MNLYVRAPIHKFVLCSHLTFPDVIPQFTIVPFRQLFFNFPPPRDRFNPIQKYSCFASCPYSLEGNTIGGICSFWLELLRRFYIWQLVPTKYSNLCIYYDYREIIALLLPLFLQPHHGIGLEPLPEEKGVPGVLPLDINPPGYLTGVAGG